MDLDILTVSSKGQVVLPVDIRNSLLIETGTRLLAYASDGYIILKKLDMPDLAEFQEKLDEAQQWAASVGYKEDEVTAIVKAYRKQKRG